MRERIKCRKALWVQAREGIGVWLQTDAVKRIEGIVRSLTCCTAVCRASRRSEDSGWLTSGRRNRQGSTSAAGYSKTTE